MIAEAYKIVASECKVPGMRSRELELLESFDPRPVSPSLLAPFFFRTLLILICSEDFSLRKSKERLLSEEPSSACFLERRAMNQAGERKLQGSSTSRRSF